MEKGSGIGRGGGLGREAGGRTEGVEDEVERDRGEKVEEGRFGLVSRGGKESAEK